MKAKISVSSLWAVVVHLENNDFQTRTSSLTNKTLAWPMFCLWRVNQVRSILSMQCTPLCSVRILILWDDNFYFPLTQETRDIFCLIYVGKISRAILVSSVSLSQTRFDLDFNDPRQPKLIKRSKLKVNMCQNSILPTKHITLLHSTMFDILKIYKFFLTLSI